MYLICKFTYQQSKEPPNQGNSHIRLQPNCDKQFYLLILFYTLSHSPPQKKKPNLPFKPPTITDRFKFTFQKGNTKGDHNHSIHSDFLNYTHISLSPPNYIYLTLIKKQHKNYLCERIKSD